MTPNFQKQNAPAWIDEAGIQLPAKRLLKSEKFAERKAEKLFKSATKVRQLLESLKAEMTEECKAVMEQVYDDNGQDPDKSKGNFTWYNFDHSMKIEVNIQDRTEFDETLIQLAKNKLDEFLDNSVTTDDEFIKQFVVDAFSKQRGGLDAKKVLSLLRYRSKVSNPLFQEAIALVEKSIRHPDSKRYFRLWVRNIEGQYEAINLNFSNI